MYRHNGLDVHSIATREFLRELNNKRPPMAINRDMHSMDTADDSYA